MNASPKKLLPLIVFAIAVTSVFSARPAQAYTVLVEQIGSNVVANGGGAFNLMGLVAGGSFGSFAAMNPSIGDITVAGGSVTQWTGFSGPSSFGPGGLTAASSNSGESVTMIGGAFENGLYLLPGYVSGTVLSDISTYNNATLASLGLTPGTYEWTWGTGANQNFTLIIEAAGVPDGGSTVCLLGFALVGLAVLRRKLRC